FHGHDPMGVATGEDGLQQALRNEYADVVLDVMLPAMSGFDVCRQLRAKRPGQAILMLTARGAEDDVLEGVRCGADDYVTNPFSVAELLARVAALMRRAGVDAHPTADPFEFADWVVDPTARNAICDGTTVSLSPREVELLALL